ncbi:hypothetical protein [Streptomyces sp. NBC_00503]|uniref:hypothetical protein n=1 Tax=Streptomyces sp. NBC_00503 TaxID=2903659 RepID=UPI002E7FF225|nr:hypothetical protein [Streptomyces sp. NBC_00503]WUD85169.1 hypothetical protein OG490_33975 [Streptomyces sp. NBC_00503]
MDEFRDAALGFPAALFTAALVVVVAFWLLVLLGAADHGSFHGHVHVHVPGHGHAGSGGSARTGARGIGGVPVTVVASLLITIAWFISFTGSVLVRRSGASGVARTALDLGVLAAALLLAWGLTRLLVRRLQALFPDHPPPSRLDFIGLTCTIRTGSVSGRFGQAEVAAQDGSTAVVQVRQHGQDVFGSGSTALLYAYDEEGEFFWVAPYDPALDPRTAG